MNVFVAQILITKTMRKAENIKYWTSLTPTWACATGYAWTLRRHHNMAQHVQRRARGRTPAALYASYTMHFSYLQLYSHHERVVLEICPHCTVNYALPTGSKFLPLRKGRHPTKRVTELCCTSHAESCGKSTSNTLRVMNYFAVKHFTLLLSISMWVLYPESWVVPPLDHKPCTNSLRVHYGLLPGDRSAVDCKMTVLSI